MPPDGIEGPLSEAAEALARAVGARHGADVTPVCPC
jgi:hypothetical protein